MFFLSGGGRQLKNSNSGQGASWYKEGPIDTVKPRGKNEVKETESVISGGNGEEAAREI